MATFNILKNVKRYWAVIFFPTFATLSIYADWNYTRKWKKKLAEQAANK